MTDQKIAALVFGALVSLGGCALVIGVDKHDVGTSDGGSGSGSADAPPPACSSSQMCTGTSTPACDVADGVCVQCVTGETGACTGTTPECGDDHACRGCDSHTECASAVCQTDGSCADDSAVAYVAPNGSGDCSSVHAPCGTIAAALLTGKHVIKVAGGGTVSDTTAPTITSGQIAIYGDAGATLSPAIAGHAVLTITGGTVSLTDLVLTGGTTTAGTGILVSGAASVSLERVKVTQNAGRGIYTDTIGGAKIHVTDSEISRNMLAGIGASLATEIHVVRSTVTKNSDLGISAPTSGGTLEVSQSTVSGNAEGGIEVKGTFMITNSYIVTNGTAGTGGINDPSVQGGVSLDTTSACTGCRFEFNTVSDNLAAANKTAGVGCGVDSFTAANNIISTNIAGVNAGAKPTNTDAATVCTFDGSNVIADDNSTLHFMGPPTDYRIGPESVALEHGTTTSPIVVDNEGTVRPQGAQKDAGANEMKQ